MSIKHYTLAELKSVALDSANAMGLPTSYSLTDVERAYPYACARCGYENPAVTDTDYYIKQHWLLEMMQLYFYNDTRSKYLIKFDVGDLKLGQVAKMVNEIVSEKEKSFDKAKADPNVSHIFNNATTFFGNMVHPSGFTDDIFGEPMTTAEVEDNQ